MSRGTGDRVVTVGRVAEHELPAYRALGDVAIYPMADTLINRAKSPVKVLEPMLMGLPIVAHRIGHIEAHVLLIEPEDIVKIASDLAAQLVVDAEAEPGQLGEGLRQEAELETPGQR